MEILTESQKSCLRLVAQGMTSKEIALRTGLSPQTVDTYLKAASAKLQVANRRDAARRLLEAEASQNLGSPTAAIAHPPQLKHFGSAAGSGSTRWTKHLSPPPLGGLLNTLTSAERTYAVLKVAVVFAAVVVALLLLIAGVLQTFR